MKLLSTRFLIFVVILLVVLYRAIECKRGGGARRGGVSRGSTSVWGRSRQSQGHDLRNNQRKSKSQHADEELGKNPADMPDPSKPSAPPSSTKVDATKVSSSGPSQHAQGNEQQRPIGWDVGQGIKPDNAGNKNIGWNTNNPSHPSGTAGSPPPYSSGSIGNSPPYSSGGTGNPPPYSSGGIGNPPPYSSGGIANPPPYSGGSVGNHPAYASGSFGNPPAYSGPPAGTNFYHGQSMYQPGQYGAPNTGFLPQSGPYYSNMNQYGASPKGGGFFGGNNYNKHGYGGFGGFGGYPGFGGYGKKFGGGFGMGFGKHAVRNVAMGLLVWHVVWGLTNRPYNVYNYYNNPEKVPKEIPILSNIIVLCPESANALCAPNTAPLCTTETTIMCVVLAQKTVPCGDNSTFKCINSTAACVDDDDKPCDGKNETMTSVNIPCITNATINGKLKDNAVRGIQENTGSTGNNTDLCVTALAVPQTREEREILSQTGCRIDNTTNGTACDSPLQFRNVTTQSSNEKTELKRDSSN